MPTKQSSLTAAERKRINNKVKYRKSYLKLYVIKKEAHPENLKQLRKMDYSAYQRYPRLVNTVIGMENGDVISQFFKEIVNEEAMQIMERQRQQHIEEDKDQHEIPQYQIYKINNNAS